MTEDALNCCESDQEGREGHSAEILPEFIEGDRRGRRERSERREKGETWL